MQLFIRSFFCLLLATCIGTNVHAQGFLKAEGKYIVDGEGKPILLRGMGLGGWMLQEPYMLGLSGVAPTQGAIRQKITDLIGEDNTNRFYEAWLQNHCTEQDIDSLAAWGFNSVRLPMHYNLFTPATEQEPEKGKTTWRAKGFQMVDSLLQWCAKNKIYLILDLHAAPGGQGNDVAIADRDTTQPSLWQSAENQQKTVALWRELARRYAAEPWIGGYDLINETNWGFQDGNDKNGCAETANAPLRRLLMDITAAIREVDQAHLIFIEANCWANNYKGIFPLWDNNMAVSFHKYWNNNDVGAIQGFLDIREQQNVPIWMGESGENSNVWFRDAIELLEKADIGWAWWPLKKLGFNNPLQINNNKDYEALVRYWRGEGAKPSAEDAYRGLMQLAADARTENNIFHKDVVDAMFRQVHDTTTIAFKPHRINGAGVVHAVDYDLGRMGGAYNDKDYANYRVSTGTNVEWNRGRQYRNDGVDIKSFTEKGTTSYAVGWLQPGEWLQYTVETLKEGTYQVQLRTAKDSASGAIRLEADGKTVQAALPLKNAAKGIWVTTAAKPVFLKKGTHKIKVFVLKGGFDFHNIILEKRP